MRSEPDAVVTATVGTTDEDARWSDLGVHTRYVGRWKAEGLGPFEAAMAQGDGFTPSIVLHYRRQVRRVARTWVRRDLGSAEGLRWHQAGFAAGDAVRWRSQGIDIATARMRRDGWEQ